jgi:hypothetical protein
MGQCTSKTLGTHNSLQWKSVDTKMVGSFIPWRNLNCFLHLCCPDTHCFPHGRAGVEIYKWFAGVYQSREKPTTGLTEFQ